MPKYAAIKELLTEKRSTFTDFGQEIEVVIPTYYVEKFNEFIINRTKI